MAFAGRILEIDLTAGKWKLSPYPDDLQWKYLSGRGFNIENISANVTMDPDVTKITMVTKGDKATVVKIEKQMKKLVDVIEVTHVKNKTTIQREMVHDAIAFGRMASPPSPFRFRVASARSTPG